MRKTETQYVWEIENSCHRFSRMKANSSRSSSFHLNKRHHFHQKVPSVLIAFHTKKVLPKVKTGQIGGGILLGNDIETVFETKTATTISSHILSLSTPV